MRLPRILIIDDLYGHNLRERRLFCDLMRIKDMDADIPENSRCDFFAEARFCSGQVKSNNYVRNSLEVVLRDVESGWPFENGSRWAMVMIDYQFPSGPLTEDGYVIKAQPGDNQFGKTILMNIAKRWPFRPLFPEERPDAFPEIPCVMFSSRPSEQVEPEVDPAGNRAFIERISTWTEGELIRRRKEFADILFAHGLVEDGALRIADVRGEPELPVRERRIVGNSLAMLRALRNARAAITKADYNFVLVQGEMGTGKEEVVRYMHDYSGRKGEFFTLDLGAKPTELIPSEIFGYEEGAFTGGLKKGAPSVFERAGAGTVFLDEIGKLKLDVLERLLSATGFGRYRRVGPNAKEKTMECQVICATNEPVEKMIEQGRFPNDLEARFKSVIYLPPLVSREGDKKKLFDYFVKQAAKENHWKEKTPVQDVYELLESYSWPGNVREMKNIVERAVRGRRHSRTIQPNDIAVSLRSASGMRQHVCKNFESLLNEIKMFRFQDEDKLAVKGAYPRFTAAASSLVSNMIDTAATLHPSLKQEVTLRPGIKPEDYLNCTGCVREIFGGKPSDFNSTKAKRLFKKLNENYDLDMTSEVITHLVKWTAKQEPEGRAE
jgi:DNA-binding NtrC family response regulator